MSISESIQQLWEHVGSIELSRYESMKVEDIFVSTLDGSQSVETAWVEAEMIFKVRRYISDVFYMLENNEADKLLPSDEPVISLEDAVAMIQEIDADFDKEASRWQGIGVEAGPEFMRLPDHAKIAFVQGIKRLLLTREEREKIALQILAAGEPIPPSSVMTNPYSLWHIPNNTGIVSFIDEEV